MNRKKREAKLRRYVRELIAEQGPALDRLAGCECPAAWWGVLPPPCPLHNPQRGTIVWPTVQTNSTTTLAPWCGICQGFHIPGHGQCTATLS